MLFSLLHGINHDSTQNVCSASTDRSKDDLQLSAGTCTRLFCSTQNEKRKTEKSRRTWHLPVPQHATVPLRFVVVAYDCLRKRKRPQPCGTDNRCSTASCLIRVHLPPWRLPSGHRCRRHYRHQLSAARSPRLSHTKYEAHPRLGLIRRCIHRLRPTFWNRIRATTSSTAR